MTTQKTSDRPPRPGPTRSATDLIGSGQEGPSATRCARGFQRVRGGDMGALPAVGGFVVLSILFAFLSPFFLTERNFANLLTQAATLVMLAMALVFVILLGEIDLSAGVTERLTMASSSCSSTCTACHWLARARRRVRGRHRAPARSSGSSSRGWASHRSS